MKRLFSILSIATIVAMVFAACQPVETEQTDPNDPTPNDTISSPSEGEEEVLLSTRPEQYRPQIHYTVHHNWTNDPNGLCYADGVWHLYYQYNPNGVDCDFGGMSWGHASSTDLMHWTEHEPVLYPDEMGAMFSGSSVVDVDNKAGFGAGAILAFYTASAEKQKICLAVSTDGGMHFTKYHGPYEGAIINSTGLANFRDPKVVWDEVHEQYVMVIAKGWDEALEFWRSRDLLNWEFVPHIFHAEAARCNMGQYECPDLFYLPCTTSNARSASNYFQTRAAHQTTSNAEGKWILVLSTMPGGYINGSGTMYFVGQLTEEGYFVADEGDYPRWLDYGADNYADVTWNNAPDGRLVMIGWMNNWDYAPGCPASIWKSAFTLPREYNLRDIEGKLVLCSEPVAELETLAGDWANLPLPLESEASDLGKGAGEKGLAAYELRCRVSLAEDATVRLTNRYGECYEVRIDSRCRKIISDRSRAGESHFAALFAVPSMAAPIEGSGDEVELRLIVDQSSVELFADGGATCVTNTVYPRTIYNRISTSGVVSELRFRPLESVWK